ncbi:hypothetical protein [Capnocytophaga leadbetteri]|uniref:hypothetical protein n=1 Tax=Capnocytophaga leadbetteri TaxID=327575 RepID=UPI0028E97946|nr:hypothetical protein [Capnocytophaga leadbetteri]
MSNLLETKDSLISQENYNKIYEYNREAENIISSLFDSVLSGEYIYLSSEINYNDNYEQLKKARTFLTYTEEIENTPNKQHPFLLLINSFKDRFVEISKIIKYYVLFLEDIKTIISNLEKDEIFILSKSKYQSVNDSETLKLFTLNLFLCFSDILFTEKQDCYQEITYVKELLSEERFSNLNLNPQIEKMKKKATFLLFKWYKRAELSGFSMLKEDKIKEYKDNINNFGDKWKDWVTYIENHYYKENEKHLFVEKIKESYIKIEDKGLKKFTCQDIYSYIKYHKEIDKKIDKLDEIISFLDKRRFCTTDNYDKNIRTIIYNYARNNRFSLFTETCDNRKDLQKEYNKIDNKDNRNYFLQYKFIDKSIELLNAELNEKNENITIDQIEEIEKYLKEIEPEYKTYKTNIEWILEHIYFIYRIPFDECIIDDIFIYSSFLLPLDNRKSKDGFEKVSDKFRELKSQLPLFRKMAEFNGDVSKVKQELFQFDEKIEKHDTKTIELMGLFSAIIAFVMGSIPTFQYMKNIYDVGIFCVAFASSLISFLLVLLLITRKTRINRRFWYQLILIVIFYIAMIVFTTYLSNKKDTTQTIQLQTEKTIIEEKITSNKAIDTLKQSKITKEHTTSTKDSLK